MNDSEEYESNVKKAQEIRDELFGMMSTDNIGLYTGMLMVMCHFLKGEFLFREHHNRIQSLGKECDKLHDYFRIDKQIKAAQERLKESIG